MPDLTAGAAPGRGVYEVFLDFEAPVTADFARETVADLAALYPGTPLAFTTRRPDRPASAYLDAVIGAPLDFDPRRPGGISGGLVTVPADQPYEPRAVFVDAAAPGLDAPDHLAHAAGHELGNALGVLAEDPAHPESWDRLPEVRAAAAVAAALADSLGG